MLICSAAACDASPRDPIDSAGGSPATQSAPPPTDERYALGGAFVGGNPRGLAEVLHAEVVVQPPSPDSALQGLAAAGYLADLATNSSLTTSEFSPRAFSPEGPFLLEQGTWIVRSGDRVLGSRYHLRWRRVEQGWQVVLLRWTRFR